MNIKLRNIYIGILFLIPLHGYALDATSTSLAQNTPSPIEGVIIDASSTPVQTFTACSQEAIENRDTKIALTRNLYNAGMAKALTERKNREKAAIALTDADEKKAALKASVETYKNQAKTAQNTLTQARKLAWQTFENDIKKCRELANEDASVETETIDTTKEPSLKKFDDSEVKTEVKSVRETIKAQFDSFKSLFN